MTDIIETSPLIAAELDRAQVDVQIATAHRFPRSIKKFQDDALSMATANHETAASCFYKLPRGGKNIEGPSIRLAEIVASCWGNLRIQARIIGDDGKFVVAQCVAHDLEKNVAMSAETRRRVTNKEGVRFNDDMIGVTANAACSIAIRNAIFKVVPKTFVDIVYGQAKKVAIGTSATLSERREKAFAFFAEKYGVPRERVLKALDRAAIQDVDLADVETLQGWHTALADNEAELDTVFPPIEENKYAPKAKDPAPARPEPKAEPKPKKTVAKVPEIVDEGPLDVGSEPEPAPAPAPKETFAPGQKINDEQRKLISNTLRAVPGLLVDFQKHVAKTYGWKTSGEIEAAKFNEVFKWIEDECDKRAQKSA